MVFQTRYLLLMALMLLFLNWVNTTGEYILGSIVKDAAAKQLGTSRRGSGGSATIGEFYAKYFTYGERARPGAAAVRGLARRQVPRACRSAVMILPVLSLTAYNDHRCSCRSSGRCSRRRSRRTRPTTRSTTPSATCCSCRARDEQKYSAKQAIDSFFVRMGDVLSAALVFVGTAVFALASSRLRIHQRRTGGDLAGACLEDRPGISGSGSVRPSSRDNRLSQPLSTDSSSVMSSARRHSLCSSSRSVMADAFKSLGNWITFAGCILVIAVLYWAQAVLVPVCLAVLLTFVLTPPVTWLQRRIGRSPRFYDGHPGLHVPGPGRIRCLSPDVQHERRVAHVSREHPRRRSTTSAVCDPADPSRSWNRRSSRFRGISERPGARGHGHAAGGRQRPDVAGFSSIAWLGPFLEPSRHGRLRRHARAVHAARAAKICATA